MNKQTEALRMALEALELALRNYGVLLLSDPPKDAWKYHGVEAKADSAITALRQAIALEKMAENEREVGIQMKADEPVAWMIWLEGNAGMFSVKREAQIEIARRNKEYPDDGRRLLPLYTRLQSREPLTWERVLEIGLECANDHSRLPYEVKIARAIEAAHGIKRNA